MWRVASRPPLVPGDVGLRAARSGFPATLAAAPPEEVGNRLLCPTLLAQHPWGEDHLELADRDPVGVAQLLETVLDHKSMTSRLLNKAASRQDSDSTSVTSQLTDRELSVFQMLGQGHSVEEIKTRLNLARKTIETYRRRAKEKLGFESVADLLRYAVKWTRTQGPGEETIPAPTASSME